MARRARLKPCPFCGERAETYGRSGFVRVWCLGCQARSSWGRTEALAIKAWNRRATPRRRNRSK